MHPHQPRLLISDVTEVQLVHVVGLCVSDANQTVHGFIAGGPSSVDDDDIFGREVHFRAVRLSGVPSRPRNDDGASCGEVKSQGPGRSPVPTRGPSHHCGLGYCSVSPTHSYRRAHQLTHSAVVFLRKGQIRIASVQCLEPMDRSKNLRVLLIVQRHGRFLQRTQCTYLLEYAL